MNCVVCGGGLVELGASLYRCPACGYTYPGEIFADPMIDTIRDQHLACERCESDLPGMPKVWAKNGKPIACPIHSGRRRGLRFWRWRARRSVPR